MNTAKDDHSTLACRILLYLYACVKTGKPPEESELSPSRLGIDSGYWIYIMRHLQADGYISGVHFEELLGGMPSVKMLDLEITPKGIEYLQENSSMNKAKDFLRTLKEIVPGL